MHFSPLNSVFSYKNIKIGSDVFIGPYAIFSSINLISIGNKVLFGPHVTIMGGNHNFKEIGTYIFDNHIKRDDDDLLVTIEDDIWIGCNSVILKGVTIGTGCIVGAGSVVTKSLPPYSICVGSPCKPIKKRFTVDQLKKHLSLISSSIYSSEYIIEQWKKSNIY